VALYETFATRLARLPESTQVHAGHDYLLNNLGFTLSREPGNAVARDLAQQLAQQAAPDMPVTTLGEEKLFNTFFRLQNPAIIAGLREHFPELPETPSPREVFVCLRALRNKW
jgi:hydroxyacylglutathione hydrolase